MSKDEKKQEPKPANSNTQNSPFSLGKMVEKIVKAPKMPKEKKE